MSKKYLTLKPMDERGSVVVVAMLVIMGALILFNEFRLKREEKWVNAIVAERSCSELKAQCSEEEMFNESQSFSKRTTEDVGRK